MLTSCPIYFVSVKMKVGLVISSKNPLKIDGFIAKISPESLRTDKNCANKQT